MFCLGFCPSVSFLVCWWFFAGLFAPLVWFGRLGLPTPWSRLFPLGFHLRCSWRAFVVGCCCRGCCFPLVLRCLWGQVRPKFTHKSAIRGGVFCQSAIDSAQNDHANVVQSMLANKEVDTVLGMGWFQGAQMIHQRSVQRWLIDFLHRIQYQLNQYQCCLHKMILVCPFYVLSKFQSQWQNKLSVFQQQCDDTFAGTHGNHIFGENLARTTTKLYNYNIPIAVSLTKNHGGSSP